MAGVGAPWADHGVLTGQGGEGEGEGVGGAPGEGGVRLGGHSRMEGLACCFVRACCCCCFGAEL
jgi:hypothetical protein